MTSRGIAVQVYAACGLEHATEFQDSRRHHGQVRHYVVLLKERPHSPQHLGCIAIPAGHDTVESEFRLISPVPGVLKRLNLSAGLFASRALEKDVVRRLAVEGRVEVDEIYALIVNAAPQDREIVAVVDRKSTRLNSSHANISY